MTSLRWWLLAWFFAYVGAAAASPLLQPRSLEIVCSGTGATKILVHSHGGPAEAGAPGLDCPLCLPQAAPAAPPQAGLHAIEPMARQPLPLSRVHVVAAMAAPPPARGPPFPL